MSGLWKDARSRFSIEAVGEKPVFDAVERVAGVEHRLMEDRDLGRRERAHGVLEHAPAGVAYQLRRNPNWPARGRFA